MGLFRKISEREFMDSKGIAKMVFGLVCCLIAFVWMGAGTVQALDFPEGYTLQVLEPTGGKIARPNDWFYAEQHHGPVYVWVLSREDASKGPYLTGLKIQVFNGVQKGTGKSPKEFCLSFLEEKKKTVQVLAVSPETKMGLFTRQCLQVEEAILTKSGKIACRINYSVFWTEGSDLAVVTIAGAPLEDWPKFEQAFNVMSEFELIDMKRFEKEPAAK